MVKSTLTDYGNLVTTRTFEKIRDDASATKINAYKKTTIKVPIHKERVIDGGYFVQVPRAICDVAYVTREDPEPLPDELPAPDLMPYQEEIVSHVATELTNKSHFYLQMDTGLGKSYVAAGLISRIGLKACIVVANKNLCKQMSADIVKAIPSANVARYDPANTRGDVVTVGKKKVYIPPCDVLIIVINTAAKMDPRFFSYFGLVIYDEVHAYCTETFSAVFFNADTARYTFGMTATPTRIDGMESVSYLHLGSPVEAASISADDEMAAGNFFGTFHAINYTGPPALTKTIKSSAGVPSPILMANQFLSDPFRLSLVAMIVIDAYNAGRYTYIFCQTRDPLDSLRRKIINVVPAGPLRDLLKKQLFIVTGKSKEEESDMANKDARIFLTTYTLSSKGLSNRRFDTLILLTPMKSNMMQITGRIFRKKSDEGRRRLIIDIVDERTFMKKQHAKRVASITSRGLSQRRDHMSYKDLGNEAVMKALLGNIDAYNVYGDDVGFEGMDETKVTLFKEVYGDVPRENRVRDGWPIMSSDKFREHLIEYMTEDEIDDDSLSRQDNEDPSDISDEDDIKPRRGKKKATARLSRRKKKPSIDTDSGDDVD